MKVISILIGFFFVLTSIVLFILAQRRFPKEERWADAEKNTETKEWLEAYQRYSYWEWASFIAMFLSTIFFQIWRWERTLWFVGIYVVMYFLFGYIQKKMRK